MVATLRSEGGGELVIAGGVRRPDLWKLRPDCGLLPQPAADSGDARGRRRFRSCRAWCGSSRPRASTVRGAHEVAPDLLARRRPGSAPLALDRQGHADAELGFAVRAALGPLDAGQAVAVAGRQGAGHRGRRGHRCHAGARRRACAAGARTAGAAACWPRAPSPGRSCASTCRPSARARSSLRPPPASPAWRSRPAPCCCSTAREAAAGRRRRIGLGDRRPCRARRSRLASTAPVCGALRGLRHRVIGRRAPDAARRQSRHREGPRRRRPPCAVRDRARPWSWRAPTSWRSPPAKPRSAMLERTRALRQWGVGAKRRRRRAGMPRRRGRTAMRPALQPLLDQAAAQGLAGVAVTGPPAALAPFEAPARLADRRRPVSGAVRRASHDRCPAVRRPGSPGTRRARANASPHGPGPAPVHGGRRALRRRARRQADGGPQRAPPRPHPLPRRRRPGDGGAGPRLAVPARGGGGDGARRDPGAPAADPEADLRARPAPPSPPSPARSSSSTAPSSPTRSPGASAGAGRTSRSSTTSRPACGRGGPGARARCAAMSTTCWRCGRSSPRCTSAWAGRACSFVGHPLIERHPWIAALDTAPLAERLALPPDRPLLVVLPGSRTSEVSRLMRPFGAGAGRAACAGAANSRWSFRSCPRCARIIERHLAGLAAAAASRRGRGGQVPRLQARHARRWPPREPSRWSWRSPARRRWWPTRSTG